MGVEGHRSTWGQQNGHRSRDTRVQGLVLQYHRCIHAPLFISPRVIMSCSLAVCPRNGIPWMRTSEQ